MNTYQSGGGYYFKEYKNGKKIRISKELFMKLNKSQRGGAHRYYHFFLKINNIYYIFLIPSDKMKNYNELLKHIKYNGEIDSILFTPQIRKISTIKHRIDKLRNKFPTLVLTDFDSELPLANQTFEINKNKIIRMNNQIFKNKKIFIKTRLFKILNPVVETPLDRNNNVIRRPLQRSNSFVETSSQRRNSVVGTPSLENRSGTQLRISSVPNIASRNSGPSNFNYNNYTEEISHEKAEEAFNSICGNIRANTISKKDRLQLEENLKLIVRYIGLDTMRHHNLLFTRINLDKKIGKKASLLVTNNDRVNISSLLYDWCDKVRPLLDSKLASTSISMPNMRTLRGMKHQNLNDYYKGLSNNNSNRITKATIKVNAQRREIENITGIHIYINPNTGKKTYTYLSKN